MKENKKNVRKGIILACIICAAVLMGILSSYAYFTMVGNNTQTESAKVETGNMALVFEDGNSGFNKALNFGETVIKKFTLENTGTLTASVSIDWLNLTNNYTNGSLTYRLTYSESENGEYKEIHPKSNVPTSSTSLTQALSSEISVPGNTKYYYNLEITLNYLDDVNQTDDLNANFQTNFKIGEVSKYRYYTLSVNPNGGTWETFTSTQEYQLQKDDTQTIPNPTRAGHTFNGWEIKGMSSRIEDETFTMGIENTTLVAKWTLNKYTITIDTGIKEVETKEIEYGSSIYLPDNLVRANYTFIGWEVTGGTLEGNKFTITDPTNISITAKWKENRYKYIVYHNKMNIDGNGYTTVDADTEEGKELVGTAINPKVKTYTGFTSPDEKSLTIQEENTEMPVLNRLDYNYMRNKYNLTVNLNGGTSTTVVSGEMYYEEAKDLGVPTKTGYDFTNWTATSGMLENNTFKIGDSDSTVTANYTPKIFTVTFNANGGTVGTQSKTVTYDSIYGDLPTPTYEGYEFLGWFTASSGGTQVISSTKVVLTGNQPLYAQWEETNFNVVNAVKAIKSGQTPFNVNPGNPKFSNIATTDEGVYATIDDYGTSYYFRGAVENNYVKFAGFYWRVIRINGNGSVRIIYDGGQSYKNGISDFNRLVKTNVSWSDYENDNKYVGYMYAPAGATASTSKTQAQTNSISSNAKTQLENWYKINIYDKGFNDYISDEIFCNDRSIPNNGFPEWSANTKLGYGSNTTAYGAAIRLMEFNSSFSYPTTSSNPTPLFVCPTTNDRFTVNNRNGNGSLTYPVGLLTADEVVAAGGLPFSQEGAGLYSNTKYYLYKGYSYWTMSPYMYNSTFFIGYKFWISSNGELIDPNSYGGYGIAPVINLSSDYVSQMVGDGTIGNEYRVE